jgi:hypothetical protein
MNEYHAKEIVERTVVKVDRITWDGSDEDGDFPSSELVNHPDVQVFATDDVGNPVTILRWENDAPVAPGASWVFYYDTQE